MKTLPILVIGLLGMTSAPAFAQHHGGAPGGAPGGPPSGSSSGHWSGSNGNWNQHGGWHGNMQNFDHAHWQGGHWWNGPYGGRVGWWWIVGPNWYWYPAAVYPFPDPYMPPGAVPGFWYWCDAYRQYYPYVGACPSGWRAVPPAG